MADKDSLCVNKKALLLELFSTLECNNQGAVTQIKLTHGITQMGKEVITMDYTVRRREEVVYDEE